MCEDPIHINNMTHESQDLLVPEEEEFSLPAEEHAKAIGDALPQQDGLNTPDKMATLQGQVSHTLDKMTQGPVNAITVLTLLDKLVNMLDTVQENQHKMEVRQDDMGGVVRGIQADMTKLSKNHSHTSNTVSKLLDKSRKVSVTMKEVRDKMERQAGQVKKLEANHAHLLKRNNFKVLIFQDENEIPSSVFVKEPVPYPRDNLQEVGGDDLSLAPPATDTNRSQDEEGLHTIDLSSDEDVGLEAELEEEGEELQDLEHMDKTRAEKMKRSSLKKVDSIKKAFSRQNIEKKMNKLGNKMVSQEQREKIKQSFSHQQKSPGEKRTSPFKVSPLSFSIRKRGGSTSSEPVVVDPEASLPTGDSPAGEAQIQLSPLGSADPDVPFTQVHSELAPPTAAAAATDDDAPPSAAAATDDAPPTVAADDAPEKLAPDVADDAPECDDFPEAPEGVSEEYALSETLPQGEEPPVPPPEEEEESHVAPPHQEVEEEVGKEVVKAEEEEEKDGEKGEKEEGMKGEMKVEEKEKEEGVST